VLPPLLPLCLCSLLQQSLEAVAASMMHYRHTRSLSDSEVRLRG